MQAQAEANILLGRTARFFLLSFFFLRSVLCLTKDALLLLCAILLASLALLPLCVGSSKW